MSKLHPFGQVTRESDRIFKVNSFTDTKMDTKEEEHCNCCHADGSVFTHDHCGEGSDSE